MFRINFTLQIMKDYNRRRPRDIGLFLISKTRLDFIRKRSYYLINNKLNLVQSVKMHK